MRWRHLFMPFPITWFAGSPFGSSRSQTRAWRPSLGPSALLILRHWAWVSRILCPWSSFAYRGPPGRTVGASPCVREAVVSKARSPWWRWSSRSSLLLSAWWGARVCDGCCVPSAPAWPTTFSSPGTKRQPASLWATHLLMSWPSASTAWISCCGPVHGGSTAESRWGTSSSSFCCTSASMLWRMSLHNGPCSSLSRSLSAAVLAGERCTICSTRQRFSLWACLFWQHGGSSGSSCSVLSSR